MWSAGGQFQTSNDGVTFTTVAQVSAYPQEGWNYVDLVDQSAGATVAPVTSAQRYFRYVLGPNNQPYMSEIEWMGYRVAAINPQATGGDVTSCPVAVTVVAQDPLESLQLNGATYTNGYLQTTYQVVYSLGNTPLVNNISPSNGSSLGGTSVTLTGQGFGSNGLYHRRSTGLSLYCDSRHPHFHRLHLHQSLGSRAVLYWMAKSTSSQGRMAELCWFSRGD